MTDVWQKTKDLLLLILGVVLLMFVLPLGAGGKLLRGIKGLLGDGGGADEARRDNQRAGELAGQAGGAIESSQEGVDRSEERIDNSLTINQQLKSNAQEARDILRQIRERNNGTYGG